MRPNSPWNLALAGALGLCCALLSSASVAQELQGQSEPNAEVELLFVQSAMTGDYDGKYLKLHQVGSTLIFSDRPNRLTGHVRTSKFVSQWGQGPDSFASNPPNASLSVFTEKGPQNSIVVLRDPKLEGDHLRYAVKVLDGEIPPHIGESTLFIDTRGRRGPHGHAGPHGGGAALLTGVIVGHAITKSNESSNSTTYVQQSPPPPCTCNCD